MPDDQQIPAFIAANFVWGLIISGWYLSVYQQPSDVSYWVFHSRLLTVTGFDWVRDHLDLIKSLAVETLPGTILWAGAIIEAMLAAGGRAGRIWMRVCCRAVLVDLHAFLFWCFLGQAALPLDMPCRADNDARRHLRD